MMQIKKIGKTVIRLIPQNRQEKEILMLLYEKRIQFKSPFLDRSRRISKLDLILKGVK